MAVATATTAAVPADRSARRARRSAAAGFLLALPPVVVIALFVGVPVVLALAFSVGFTGGLNSVIAAVGQNVHRADGVVPTFAAYGDVFATEAFWQDLALTLGVTVASTAIVLVLAGGIGLYLRLRGGWLARVLSAVAIVPLFIPVVIASWAILTFYAADGFLRSLLAQVGVEGPVWSYSAVAIVIGSAWTSLPFAVLMIASGLQSVPDALIEAARDAGAGTVRIVRTILLPMCAVPIVIAVTFTAIGVIGSYTVPYFTGPNAPTMLGVALASYFTSYNQPQQSLVMAFVVFLAAAVIGAFYVWANFRSARQEGRI
ncbi:ABC transporter permease subunit [Leifsonia sp. C5G2]|uniref:ABC transporter permease n=1 Tax=Leifsonia sp. C5G2 TaxID=2735269 RepID=UPI0015857488|nr:ABC transporter permease subunit [Leifsonia sp. C5G2]NUU06300.1 ABC transporter permease subunit [Leifsonia sp. C5G2]